MCLTISVVCQVAGSMARTHARCCFGGNNGMARTQAIWLWARAIVSRLCAAHAEVQSEHKTIGIHR